MVKNVILGSTQGKEWKYGYGMEKFPYVSQNHTFLFDIYVKFGWPLL